MPWFKVDDNLADHPKVKRIPRSQRAPAIGLWTLAGTWAARYLRDGLVPDYMIEELASKQSLAEALTAADLWHKHGHDCDQCPPVPPAHYLFHDWASQQPTKADVQADRDAAKERMRKARERKKAERSANVRANESEQEYVFADRSEDVRSTPTRPDPTRPLSTSVDRELRGDRQAALPASDGTPPLFCKKHPNGHDGPCGPCADARKIHRAWFAAETERGIAAAAVAAESVKSCPNHCVNGWIEDENHDPVSRCSHLKGNAA